MIKILVIYPPSLDNVGYWRLYRPLDVMCKLYPGIFELTYKVKDLNFGDIITHDVIITRRPWGQSAGQLVELLQTARQPGIEKPVIFDEDDAVMYLPDTHDLYNDFAGEAIRKQYIEALKCASTYWFSTPAFMESIPVVLGGAPSVPGFIIPNAVLPSDLPEEPAPDEGLFGWQGRAIQAHDLISGWDWYERHKENPLIKQWIFFGWKPPLRHMENASGPPIPYMSNVYAYVDSFKKNPKAGMFGINAMWKPLIDCVFNDHKSNINYLVAAVGGGYCISNYSGKPGWEYVAKDPLPYPHGCELWRAAKDDIIENYNLIKTAQMRAESIFALVPQFLNTTA